MTQRAILLVIATNLATCLAAMAAETPGDGSFPDRFTLFETGQVRPLALSLDGNYLYAANTPDHRLEIFRVKDGAAPQGPLAHVGSVQVGLEPIALAVRGRARGRDQVWVVNHLSDSVSIVDVRNPRAARVVRTLMVGDEPRDIVFAGAAGDRAFITTAHRGQNHPLEAQLTTPGVGRADVWVFDADQLGAAMGGEPLTIVTLFSDTPRALAVSPDGGRVYAAAFHSGNRTTSLHDLLITNGGVDAPDGMGLPGPNTNFQGIAQPETGLVVQNDGSHWVDGLGRVWDDAVRFDLPDKDVFVIDADADPPRRIAGPEGFYSGVGTILFNMVVNPATGKVYVSNTEALNLDRFEGPGTFAGSTVRGNLHQSRITVLDGSVVHPRHLNKHVDFSQCCVPIPNAENDRSLATPLEMAVSGDGTTLYLAAFGSSKIGVFDTAALENDTFVPDAADHIELSGGGPSGVQLDEARGRLYVLTRFDNAISVIDTTTRVETHHLPLFNPEPENIVAGRPLLYDARFTSSNGTTSCASCHVFGDLDSLAWDLGAPDAEPISNPGPFALAPFLLDPAFAEFQPLKGPMTTQSLRGLANHGPMHWRGDRTGANDAAASAQPDTGLFDENAALNAFNVAFEGLNGRHEPLTEAEMQSLTDFLLQITYPPNPNRSLDNSLTPAQQRGRDHFMVTQDTVSVPNSPFVQCSTCHVTDPQGNAGFGVATPGFFGADGKLMVEGDDFLSPENGTDVQPMKVPHLRNLYQKVGMFGMPNLPNGLPGDDSHRGDQIRGFGFLHDGSTDTIASFMRVVGFSQILAPNGFPPGPAGDELGRDVEQFLLAFDSNLAPIVGQQVTLTGGNGEEVAERIDLLIERATTGGGGDPHGPECELVVTTHQRGFERGFLYLESAGVFRQSEQSQTDLTAAQLRALAEKGELTYTCAPLGSGYRLALDADLDGCYNVSEEKAGFDPRDAGSKPPGCPGIF